MACLDDKGRLYVAESDGRNLTTKKEIEKELPRFIRRLVDTNGDGIYDESTIFADKMTIDGDKWKSEKAIFSNDLLELKQVKLVINSLEVIPKANKFIFFMIKIKFR